MKDSSNLEILNAKYHVREDAINIKLDNDEYFNNAEVIDFLNKFARVIDFSKAKPHIEKGRRYVVVIPEEYREDFESGKKFLTHSKDGKLLYPSLREIKDGKNQFAGNLPIKEEVYVKGDPVGEVAVNLQNVAIQLQMKEIADKVEKTYQIVNEIKEGLEDDRIALIKTGKEQLNRAMLIENENLRDEEIRVARNNMTLGMNQLGFQFKREIDKFKPIEKNMIVRGIRNMANLKNGANTLNEKDEEIEKIQNLFELYLEAYKLISMSYLIQNEGQCIKPFKKEIEEFLKSIDYSNVKTINYVHKHNEKDNTWFFNDSLYCLEHAGQSCEKLQNPEYAIELEMTGEKLLEVINNG